MSDDSPVPRSPRRRRPEAPEARGRSALGAPLHRVAARVDARRGNTEFGAALRAGALARRMRLEAALSQKELGELLGVSQARISEIEAGTGRHGPSWDIMERIAAACGRRIGLVAADRDALIEPMQMNMMMGGSFMSAYGEDVDVIVSAGTVRTDRLGLHASYGSLLNVGSLGLPSSLASEGLPADWVDPDDVHFKTAGG